MATPSFTHKDRRTLNRALKTLRVTMKSIASALGVSPSALRKYRRGSRAAPLEVLERVAALLRYQAERLTRDAHTLERLVKRLKTE